MLETWKQPPFMIRPAVVNRYYKDMQYANTEQNNHISTFYTILNILV